MISRLAAFLFLVVSLRGVAAMAAPATAGSVAAVAFEDFTPGRQWTWDYLDQTGAVYSTERYTVLGSRGREVELEMSTQLAGESSFRAHHRVRVNVDQCLAAYRNPAQVQTWSLKMFYLEGEKWHAIEMAPTLVFEEKFNCNAHVYDSREFKTEVRESDAGQIFRQLRWRKLAGSWFLGEGPERGVAFEKAFTHASGAENYVMRLRLNK